MKKRLALALCAALLLLCAIVPACADQAVETARPSVKVSGVVTAVRESRRGSSRTHTIEILDDHGKRMEYLQLLYDRVPTLPQSLHGDFGALKDLWQNIAYRVARTIR